MLLPQHDNTCLTASASTDFFTFVKFFNENIMYTAIYRVVFSSSWFRGYNSPVALTLTCLQHSLLLLCKHFWRKPSSKLNRSPTFSEHILTTIFLQKFFQFSLMSGSRLCWGNNENIFSLSTYFAPMKLNNSQNWLVKCWLYSWSTYALSFASTKILLAVHGTVFPGSPKVLKISSWISRNVSSTKMALLSRKLLSPIAPIREHKSWLEFLVL